MKRIDLLNSITRIAEIKIIKINSFKNGVFNCLVVQDGITTDIDIKMLFVKMLFNAYIFKLENSETLKMVEHLSTAHFSEYKKYRLNKKDYRYIKIYKWINSQLTKNNKEII